MPGQARPAGRDPRLERAGAVAGRGMEDADVTGRMSGSLVTASEGRLGDRRVRAYIGLGANVGDPERTLGEAVHALAALPVLASAAYRASMLPPGRPHGPAGVPQRGRRGRRARGPDPEAGALVMLTTLKDLERAFGRRRRRRWGPRELDLDILVFGRSRIKLERTAAARSIDAATDPSKAAKLLQSRIPPPQTACSSSHRSPTLRRASSRPAGTRPSRPRAVARPRSKALTRSARSGYGTPAGGWRRAPAVSPGSGSAAPSRPPRQSLPARLDSRERSAATRPPRPAPSRGRRARRPSSAAYPAGRTPSRRVAGSAAGGSARRRSAAHGCREEPRPSENGASCGPNESVVPASNQHSEPAESPVRTTPSSHARR
jgi:hypothetical protein